MNREDVEDLIVRKNKEIERLEKLIDMILSYPLFTEECPLSLTDDYDEEQIIYDACDCYYDSDGDNCDDYKKCWLKYFERKIKDERNAR